MDEIVFDLDEQVEESPKELPKLTDAEIQVLSYVEQLYWETGKVPSQAAVVEGLDPLTSIKTRNLVKRAFEKERFQEALANRGLEFKLEEKVLSPKQIVLVNMLLNVGDKKSLRQKLELLSVTQTQYNAWLRDPAFHQYLNMRTEQLFEHSDHEAYKSLVEQVMNGDVTAMKLFFEMRGIYNPRLTIDINIETVVYKLVEVVARHVKDPQILQAIAAEVEDLGLPKRAISA
jgi:Helix-turn-helix of insertion element transposase